MFEEALSLVLNHEGYYANVAGDTGGETYRGISRRYHPDWAGWRIVDYQKNLNNGKLPHNYHVKDMALDSMVADFYKKNFWDRIYLDMVKDSNLQQIIFDAFVNSGSNAIKLLQNVLNNSFGLKVSVDGAVGNETIQAVNRVNPQLLFDAYKQARKDYYYRVAQNGQNLKFLPGWLKRIGSFNYTAVAIPIGLIIGAAGLFFLIHYLNKQHEKNN